MKFAKKMKSAGESVEEQSAIDQEIGDRELNAAGHSVDMPGNRTFVVSTNDRAFADWLLGRGYTTE